MANTFLSDLDFIPQVFAGYVDGVVRKESRFFNSGVIVDTAALIPTLGNSVTLPSWNGLAGDADVMGETAPTTNALASSMQVATVLQRVKKYGSNDLVADFAGSDPLQNVGAKVGKFWANQLDKLALVAAIGAVESIGGSVIKDITGEVGAAASISASAIIDTRALLGEYVDEAGYMVVHPDILASLQKQELTSVRPGADGRLITTYQGMEIIVSATAGLKVGTQYNTLICRPGAVGYADGTNAAHVLETAREIGFADSFATQKRFVLHPAGAKFVGAINGATATNVELGAMGNWQLGAEDINHFGIRMLLSNA